MLTSGTSHSKTSRSTTSERTATFWRPSGSHHAPPTVSVSDLSSPAFMPMMPSTTPVDRQYRHVKISRSSDDKDRACKNVCGESLPYVSPSQLS